MYLCNEVLNPHVRCLDSAGTSCAGPCSGVSELHNVDPIPQQKGHPPVVSLFRQAKHCHCQALGNVIQLSTRVQSHLAMSASFNKISYKSRLVFVSKKVCDRWVRTARGLRERDPMHGYTSDVRSSTSKDRPRYRCFDSANSVQYRQHAVRY